MLGGVCPLSSSQAKRWLHTESPRSLPTDAGRWAPANEMYALTEDYLVLIAPKLHPKGFSTKESASDQVLKVNTK